LNITFEQLTNLAHKKPIKNGQGNWYFTITKWSKHFEDVLFVSHWVGRKKAKKITVIEYPEKIDFLINT
jgi:hypothetical protein